MEILNTDTNEMASINEYDSIGIGSIEEVTVYDENIKWDEDQQINHADSQTIRYWQNYSAEMQIACKYQSAIERELSLIQEAKLNHYRCNLIQDMRDFIRDAILQNCASDYEFHAQFIVGSIGEWIEENIDIEDEEKLNNIKS